MRIDIPMHPRPVSSNPPPRTSGTRDERSELHAGVTLFPDIAQQAVRVREGQRQAVVVLGMHRSGTSVITQAMSSLGAQLPLRLLPPMADSNPHGFFEPKEIVAVHERLLASAGTSWFDWNLFPKSWSESQAAQSIIAELIAAVHADYDDASLFVLKDPRICRFAAIWMRIFSELEVTPFVVLPFRNPIEVAKSLRFRDGFPLSNGYLLWLRHVLDAELSSRDFPRVFLRYEDFIEDGRREIDRVMSGMPLQWPRQSARAYDDIAASIDVSLRHHPATHEDMINRSDIFEWLRDTYEAYEKLCADPLDRDARYTLDRIALAFNTACEAFAPAFQGLREQIAEQTARLTEMRHSALAHAKAVQAELGVVAAAVSSEDDGSTEARRAEHASLSARISELETALEAERARVGTHLEASASLSARILELETALGAERARVGTHLEASAVLSARISELEIDLDAEKRRTQALKADVAHITVLERELADLRHKSVAMKSHAALIPELQQKLSAMRQRAIRLEQELGRIADLEIALGAAKAEARRAMLEAEARDREVAQSTRRTRLIKSELHGLAEDQMRPESAIKRGLQHAYWALTGQLSGRLKSRQNLNERMRIVATSGYFDSRWYLATYPDVAASGRAPVRHFCESGLLEGRRPGPEESSLLALQALLEGK
jgi:hypothetical protein